MTYPNRLVTASALASAAMSLCALPAFAQEVGASLEDRVIVQTSGEYVSFPPEKIEKRGETSEYTINMRTAIVDGLGAADQEPFSMTWTPNASTHTICFNHSGVSRCRDLVLPLDAGAPPRFKPTLISRWPTVYVRFTDLEGKALLICYSGGIIETAVEQMEKMRAAHPNQR